MMSGTRSAEPPSKGGPAAPVKPSHGVHRPSPRHVLDGIEHRVLVAELLDHPVSLGVDGVDLSRSGARGSRPG